MCHHQIGTSALVDNNVCPNVMTFWDKWHVNTQISLSTRAIASIQITFVWWQHISTCMAFRAKRHVDTQNPLSTRALIGTIFIFHANSHHGIYTTFSWSVIIKMRIKSTCLLSSIYQLAMATVTIILILILNLKDKWNITQKGTTENINSWWHSSLHEPVKHFVTIHI